MPDRASGDRVSAAGPLRLQCGRRRRARGPNAMYQFCGVCRPSGCPISVRHAKSLTVSPVRFTVTMTSRQEGFRFRPWKECPVSPRPVIGIATQTQEAVPGHLPRCWIMSQRYVRVLTDLGAVPWLIPLLPGDEATLRAIYDQLDGVFLTGGVDVDPSHYGEPRHPLCGPTDPERDAVE